MFSLLYKGVIMAKKTVFRSVELFLFLFFVLNVSLVYSDTVINVYNPSFNFDVSFDNSLNICACIPGYVPITIVNRASYGATYNIKSLSHNFLDLDESFYLAPGESKTVFAGFSGSCRTSILKDSFLVSSSLGIERTYYIDVNIDYCNNIALNLNASANVVAHHAPIFYDLIVQNTGSFKEMYSFDLGKYSKYALADTSSIVLNPGQIGHFNIKLILPYELTGSFSVPFNVYAEYSKQSSGVIHNLTVRPEYNFNLSVKSKHYFCSDLIEKGVLKIINNDDFDNTFLIESNLSIQNKVVVPKKSYGLIEFDNSKIKPGWNRYDFYVRSKYSNFTKHVYTDIYSDTCYDLNVSVSDSVELFGINSFPITLTNKGFKPQIFSVVLPELFFISNNTVYLGPNESKTLIVYLNSSDDLEYKLPLRIISGDYIFKKNVFVNYHSFDSSYSLKPLKKRLSLTPDSDNFYTVSLINKGLRSALFNVSVVEKPDFATIADNKLVFLNPGDSVDFDVLFNINESLFPGDYTIKFKVDVVDEHYSFYRIVSVKLRNRSVFYKAFVWIKSNLLCFFCLIIILLLLLLLLYLFISRPKNIAQKNTRKKIRNRIVWGFILLLVLLLLFLLRFYPLHSIYAIDSDADFALYSGEDLVINLTSYFNDPDNDSLSFGLQNSSFFVPMDYNIIDNVLYVHIPENFTGSFPLMFYANDSEFVVNSSEFSVEVYKKPNYSLKDYVYFYRFYLAWLFLLLIFALYSFALFVWAGKKTKGQLRKTN